MRGRPPRSTLFPYTTLFRSPEGWSILAHEPLDGRRLVVLALRSAELGDRRSLEETPERAFFYRSEEHTSELQSLTNLVCRLLLEKKKRQTARRRAVSTPGAT